MLWNLEAQNWDDRLLQLFALNRAWLPQCRPNCHDYGRIVGTQIPVKAVHGDQPAALFANGEPDPETVYINIGTGAFVLESISAMFIVAVVTRNRTHSIPSTV